MYFPFLSSSCDPVAKCLLTELSRSLPTLDFFFAASGDLLAEGFDDLKLA